jgi:hypothetical protein
MSYSAIQIENLKKNLKNTNWNDLELVDGVLIANYYGNIVFPIGGGRYQPYSGITKCKITDVNKMLLNTTFNYGHDQQSFIQDKFDYQPL